MRAGIKVGFLFLTLLIAWQSKGQVPDLDNDSLLVKKNAVVVYADTTIVFKKDSLIRFPDSLIVKIRDGNLVRWFNQYLMVEKPIEKMPAKKDEEIDEESLWYNGKIIGNIYIQKLDVFGTSIIDTTWENDSDIIRFGNKVHIKTHNFVIRNSLLFKKGDKAEFFLLRESERILRSQVYVNDVRIYPVPVKGNPDMVDIMVVEKDVWSIGPIINFRSINALDLGIKELNLLGMGHQFRNTLFFKLDEKREYELLYRIPNIWNSFTAAQVTYSNRIDYETLDLSLDKDFISSETKFGGGIGYSRFNGIEYVYDFPETYENNIRYEALGAWLGRSLLQGQTPNGGQKNLILSSAIEYDRYFRRPQIFPDSNLQYQNHTLLLGSITYSERNYYRSNYIFGYGRTEDVPIGKRVEFTTGYDYGELFNRPYASLSFTHSYRFKKLGYFSNEYSIGSFFRGRKSDQGIFELSSFYFTRLFGRNKGFKKRFFLQMDARIGNKRRNNEIVDLRKQNGIRGLRSNLLRGYSKLYINSTYAVFSPWKLLGFRLAFAGNLDLGYVSSQTKKLLKQDPIIGIGCGIEANNENLVFGILQLQLSYFPNPPDDASAIGISAGVRRTLKFKDFAARKPSLIDFADQIHIPR
jgi:hypothetical protein